MTCINCGFAKMAWITCGFLNSNMHQSWILKSGMNHLWILTKYICMLFYQHISHRHIHKGKNGRYKVAHRLLQMLKTWYFLNLMWSTSSSVYNKTPYVRKRTDYWIMTYHKVCNKSKRMVPLVEQELLTLQENISSHPVFVRFMLLIL